MIAEPNASIVLQDNYSKIIGSTLDICGCDISGDGEINGIPAEKDFSYMSFGYSGTYKAYGDIEFNGNVNTADNINLTFKSSRSVEINGPFEIGANTEFEIKNECFD